MRVLIFGGSGFLGKSLSIYLSKKKHKVTIFDKKKIPTLLNTNGKFILECTKNQNLLDGVKCVDYGMSRIFIWENS